jgi:hypothetical protein
MKSEMKKYEKPTIEVVDVQWNEAIAGSPTGGGVSVQMNSQDTVTRSIWFGHQDTEWNTTGF